MIQSASQVKRVFKGTRLLFRVPLKREAPLRNWCIFAGMASGYACSILDTTITQVALPSLRTQLHADLTTAGWIMHAYNVTFVIGLIIVGRLSDQFGRKRLFLLGMSIFAGSSLACALAPSLTWLILFRIIQGAGGACLGAVGFAIVSSIFLDTRQRTLALGIWSALAAVSAMAGPILGGLVVGFSWRWIFFLNIPWCLLGIWLTATFLPSQDNRKSARVDGAGMILLAITLISFLLLMVQANTWGAPGILLLLLTGVVSLVGFLVVETRSPVPLITLSLFRTPSFSASCLGMFLFWLAYQGATLLLSLYYLNAQAMTPEQTALLLLPVPLANVCTSLFLKVPWSAWIRATVGIACGFLGFVWLIMISHTGFVWYATLPASLLIGSGASLCFISFHITVVSEVPQNMLGQASGIFNTCRQLGTTMGAALLMSSLNFQLARGLSLLDRNVSTLLQNDQHLSALVRQQAAKHMDTVFHHVLVTGAITAQPFSLMDATEWNIWFNQQLHLVVLDAFDKTWLLSSACACAAFLTIPFLRRSEAFQKHLSTEKGNNA